jgi:hypothetical protein
MNIGQTSPFPEKPLESPFKITEKKRGNQELVGGTGTPSARRRINVENEPNPLSHITLVAQNLNRLYQFNFNSQPTVLPLDLAAREQAVRQHSGRLEEIKTQIEAIEKVLAYIENDSLTIDCRNQISSLLLINSDHHLIMAELGMILFYLDSKNYIPSENSLISFRASVMQEQVDSYACDHAALNMHPLIPSGKIQYILRAFAHMIFTSDQTFNRGGLYAIRELLTNPLHLISKYLQHEHLQHILNVLNNIGSDSSFDALFKTQVKIHPSMEEAIRLDLKLPQDALIQSIHVFYACMISIFIDVRQGEAPNCYAIAASNYVTENGTYANLYTLLNSLKSGVYSLTPDLNMPLAPLLEKRLAYSHDFELLVQADQAQKTILMQNMYVILGLEAAEFEENPKMPLREILRKALEENMSSDKRQYAEKLYHSYKCSALVQLQIAINEFAYMNSSESGRSYKEKIIENMIFAIEGGSKKWPTNFRNKFKEGLERILWLENCSENDIKIESGSLLVGHRQVKKFNGNVNDLLNLFKRSLRVFFLTKDTDQTDIYKPIWTIRELNEVLLGVFKQVKQNSAEQVNLSAKSLETFPYKKRLSTFCADQIGMEGISARNLAEADCYIFNQKGGLPEVCLNLVYGIQVAETVIDNCNTPFVFLEKLLGWMKNLNRKFMNVIPRLLIQTRGQHVWTLTPSCWRLLIDHSNNFNQFIDEIVYNPLKQRLSSLVPAEVVERVIVRHARDGDVAEAMRVYFKNKRLTFKKFKDELLRNISVNERGSIETIIEEEFSSISITLDEIRESLRILKLENLPESILVKLFEAVNGLHSQPFVLAEKLRFALIDAGVAIIDPFQLEMSICHVKNLPLSIHMGDSNWTDEFTEDPRHISIIIKMSYITNDFHYWTRRGDTELYESSEDYRNFKICYPTNLIN